MAGEAREAGSQHARSSGGALPSREGDSSGTMLGGRPITVKLQIDLPGGARIGPGKIRLLELIEEAGSLSRAAEAMRVSYRRAWLFVQHINNAFDEPAVATPEHGHGGAAARLTDFGKELIHHYRRMEATAEAHNADSLRWLAGHQKP